MNEIEKLINLGKKMRKTLLETSLNSGEPSHIGGALSIVDILAVLYNNILNINLAKPADRFILSKGHGFLALLSVLYCQGYISKKKLMTFQTNGSEFIAHPIENPRYGIESSNGSLGQGLSFGIGISLAYKKQSRKEFVYVLVGDGECYEGSIWEAAISATELELGNLTVIVDCNGHQNDGVIGKKMNYENLKNKWEGFGWNTVLCDGHNMTELLNVLKIKKKNIPTAIIAKTIKGKGINFMENNNDWHHGRLTRNLFEEAIKFL
jgi:transketolase